MQTRLINLLLCLMGALGGGLLGYHLFFWIAGYGFYALILPGALLGLGGGALCRQKSRAGGVLCGLLALGLGVYTEWRFAPFVADNSFAYFLMHLHELTPITQLMIAAGAVFGYWFGQGREEVRREDDPRKAKTPYEVRG